MLRAACLCLVLLFPGAGGASAQQIAPVEISHVSGKPVPRFEALRFAAANGRTGPSEDHPIAWRYERVGLPMLVIKETRDWRYVRDPDGDEVWMHERMLAPAATAMALTPVAIYERPDPASRAVAQMERGALVGLGRCEAGFCQVESGRNSGWAALSALWGAGLSRAAPEPASQ